MTVNQRFEVAAIAQPRSGLEIVAPLADLSLTSGVAQTWNKPGGPMATTNAEIDRYFAMIDRRAPRTVSRSIRWLRKPSSLLVRLAAALLLILGGIFGFLPILGLWMLPLGLLLISQDIPFLQKPLVGTLVWVEAKWRWLKLSWRFGSCQAL